MSFTSLKWKMLPITFRSQQYNVFFKQKSESLSIFVQNHNFLFYV